MELSINPYFVVAALFVIGGIATGLYFFFGPSQGESFPGSSVKQSVKKALRPTIQVQPSDEKIGTDPRWKDTLESIEMFQLEASERESELLAENAALRAEIDRINSQLGGILESTPKVEVPVKKKEEPKS